MNDSLETSFELRTKTKAELHLQQTRDVLASAVLFDQGPGQLVVEGHDLSEAQRKSSASLC